MARSKAQSGAVYRGQQVKQFTHDLTNYSELRRGLSPAMRAQTMSKTELRDVDARITDKYIEELNRWRGMSQAQKAGRAQASGSSPIEQLFNQAVKSGYFTGTDKATLMTANIKLKTMTKEQAKMELSEDLNVLDRTRSSDFYKAAGYLEDDNFDPQAATDDMLREIVVSGYIQNYPDISQSVIDEYIRRLGAGGADEYASEQSSYASDILAIAKLIIG